MTAANKNILENEFRRLFNLDRLKKNGSQISIEVSEEECIALAKRFSISKVVSLKADCSISKLSRKEKGDYKLSVKMTSDIIQQCFMTLNDVKESIFEEISIIFIYQSENIDKDAIGKEIEFEVDEEDLELINNTEVDLGEYVAEYLALSMSSYPRQAEVSGKELGCDILNEDTFDAKSEKKNPFNVLQSLKY